MRIGYLTVKDKPHGTFKVYKPTSVFERSRGLLGKPKLNSSEGMWISPCNSVHTIGMKYSLDIIYLNKQLQIVKIVENLKPLRTSGALRAHSTLELVAGGVKQYNLLCGDELAWSDNA